MERIRDNIAETRASTDASLVAERASTDIATDRPTGDGQRTLDDLIERDRIAADLRLMTFRADADRVLARRRSVAKSNNDSLSSERGLADEVKRAERAAADAALQLERQRADMVVEAERQQRAADLVRLQADRQATDDQLSAERRGADVAVSDLHISKTALTRAELEEVRRDEVLGIVTHDLRSPLCIIAMGAETIARDSTEPSTREVAEDVSLAAARMERLLVDLLDAARIESGMLRIAKLPHDVGALMREVLHSYKPLFAARGMNFEVDMLTTATNASFDHDRIVQVFSNLLSNALKFTPANGTVQLHAEPGEQQIEFVLHNSGPGIDSSALPHIFKRFWQIDSDFRRGLGLGLYICEKIIEAHAGRIWVESAIGQGATFRFTLPTN